MPYIIACNFGSTGPGSWSQQAGGSLAVGVVLERPDEERVLVAEGRMKAARQYACLLAETLHAGALVAKLPEEIGRGFDDGGLFELARSSAPRHTVMLLHLLTGPPISELVLGERPTSLNQVGG